MGFWELILTLIIALLVLGPQRMTSVARQLGRAWQQLQTLRQQLTQEWSQQLKETQLAENEAKAKQADQAYHQES